MKPLRTTLLLLFLLATSLASGQQNPDALVNFPYDYRGIIHLHSELSHDCKGKFADIEKAAKKHGIDFIVTTDHWSPKLYEKSRRGVFGNTLFIAGAEISRRHGPSILALPLPQHFIPKHKWSDNVAELKHLGATVFLGHMELARDDELRDFDGLEITNFHALAQRGKKIFLPFRYFQAIPPYNWDLGFLIPESIPMIRRWRTLETAGHRPIPVIAGNDTHDNFRLFQKFGPKLGSYDRTFRAITTHVWANELSEAAILEAIKKGRSYFAFEVFGDSRGFRFYLQDDSELYLPGSMVALGGKLDLVVKMPKYSGKIKVTIVKDGLIWAETSARSSLASLQHPLKEPGVYQVEITKNGKPWIFSNAILVQ